MGTTDYENERRMGDWVCARCRKRAEEHGKPMPPEVEAWLGTIKWNPGAKNTEATDKVLGWLIKTIVDPDWPRTP